MTDLPVFTRILLVTDFSQSSQAAVPFAHLLAEHYGAIVFAAHVISEIGATADTATETVAQAEVEMRSFLAANPFPGVQVESIIERGAVAEVIANLVREKHIDLVAVGTHGRSGVGKLLLGSVAQRIFNVAPCPVLSVSPRAVMPSLAAAEFARILYPTDFSAESLTALPYALSLAKMGNSELILLHATGEVLRQEVLQQYQRRLNELIPPQARSWCKSDALVITGNPAEVILKAAAEQNADFVVISAHPAEGSFTVPLTTSYQVVAHAPCAVLRIRS